MMIEIKPHYVERFQAALDKRQELLRMRTNDKPRDYDEQLNEVHRIIAEAVSVAASRQDYDEQYLALSWGLKR